MNWKPHIKSYIVPGLLLAGLAAAWIAGGSLCAPDNHPIAPAPADLPVENVRFYSSSGATLRGWHLTGEPGCGAVILLHGNRSTRASMIGRARFLWHAGYSVLLFDFQAHGESPGDHLTFGHLESLDARAAVDFLRKCLPGEKIAVLGESLGGAAAILAQPPLRVDALVLESVFPTIEEAVQNRLVESFGRSGKHLAPLLLCQLRPRLGFGPEELHPIDHVGELTVPKLFIAGTADRKTIFRQSIALELAAADPKQFWAVEGAGHENLHLFATDEYEKRILEFLGKHLR